MNDLSLIGRLRNLRILLAAPLLFGAALCHPATFSVTITNDSGAGSLRQAVIDANALAGADDIILPSGIYMLTVMGAGENAAATGDLDITGDLTITGEDPSTTIIDGNATDRVFDIRTGVVTMSGVTVRNGDLAGADGGGVNIADGAGAIVSNVVIRANSAREGGGIANEGSLVLVDSWLQGNSGLRGGGLKGGTSAAGTTLDRVLLSENIANEGGGLSTRSVMSLTNVTFSGNSAGDGGAIQTFNPLTLLHSTIVSNVASGSDGGFLIMAGGSVTARNTLLADNAGGNSSDPVISEGFNIDNDGTAALSEPTDQSGTGVSPLDVKVGPLQDNGGPTPTHALLADSPALNLAGLTGAPATDQRGGVRDATPDIGAFELAPAAAGWMTSGSFTGDSSASRIISGLGFTPDLVIIKSAGSTEAMIRTSTMATNQSKSLGPAGGIFSNALLSFTPDGFVVGNHTAVNQNSQTIYWVAFRQAPQLQVGTFTGNGTGNRDITGIGFQPDYVLVANGNGAGNAVHRFAGLVGDASMWVQNGLPQAGLIQAMLADGFQVGSAARVNQVGGDIHYVAFRNAVGQVAVSNYIGNGSSPRDITGVGFQPGYVLVHAEVNNQAVVHRSSTVPGSESQFILGTANGTDGILQLQPDGFQVGTVNSINANVATIHYLAFGNAPANFPPTLTSFSSPVDTTTEDTEVEVSFADLAAAGDENDVDGTVAAFIVKTISTGTLKIGTTAGSATAWSAGTNDTIDASNNAYWTPELAATGTNNAFEVVAQDDAGLGSTPNVTVQINVTASPGLLPEEAWNVRYDGPPSSGEDLRAMTVDGQGNVYVTGVSVGQGTGVDCLTVKYDPNGVQLWTARYNGPVNGGDRGNAIAVDPLGNVTVAGESQGTNNNPDYIVIQYDPMGAESWVSRYNSPGNGNDTAYKIALDVDGSVYVTGDSDNDIATVKYSGSGSEVWVRRVNGPANESDRARDLAVNGNGEVYVGGSIAGVTNSLDFLLIKYDGAGNELWTRTYSGPFSQPDQVAALALDGAGNVIITGSSQGSGTLRDYATVKYDPNGDALWVRRYDGSANGQDDPVALAIDSEGGILITGSATDAVDGLQAATLKYGGDGNLLWVEVLGRTNDYSTRHLTVDLANNVYVTGTGHDGLQSDILTAKYDPVGNLIWTRTYDNGGFNDRGIAVALDWAARVIVSGVSFGGSSQDDYVTLKYDQPGVPVLGASPQNLTVYEGESVVFSVTVTNSPTPSFQWLFEGSALPDATNATLSLGNTQPQQAGDYRVTLSNSFGVIVTPAGTLTVLASQAPTITSQPQDQNLSPGNPLNLSVGHAGGGMMRFQWRLNGVNLPGATNDSFVIGSVLPPDSGSYSVVVGNELGSVVSAPADVVVTLGILQMTDNFAGQMVMFGVANSGRTNNVGATSEAGEPAHADKVGGKSMWIGWLSAGQGIATFTTVGSGFDTLLAVYSGNDVASLTLLGSDDDSGGFLNSSVSFNTAVGQTYRVAVDGFGGATGDIVLNWSFEATTNEIPVITGHPTHQVVADGDPVTFAVDVAPGETGLSYQWLFNGSPISGADSNDYSIASVMPPDTGQYSVRISRGAAMVDTLPAELQIQNTGAGAQPVFASNKLLDALGTGQYLLLGNPGGGGGGLGGSGGSLARGYTGTQVFNNQTTGTEPGEPLHCGVLGGASSWFVYFAQETGELEINTDGSNFDTILSLYWTGGPGFGDLIPLNCDDNSGLDGEDSALSIPIVTGGLYAIAVDGVGGASGTVVLNFGLRVPAQLTSLGQMPSGENIVRLAGQPEGQFQIQHSTDLILWTPLVTTNLPTWLLDFVHYGSTNMPQSFYRAMTLSTE